MTDRITIPENIKTALEQAHEERYNVPLWEILYVITEAERILNTPPPAPKPVWVREGEPVEYNAPLSGDGVWYRGRALANNVLTYRTLDNVPIAGVIKGEFDEVDVREAMSSYAIAPLGTTYSDLITFLRSTEWLAKRAEMAERDGAKCPPSAST